MKKTFRIIDNSLGWLCFIIAAIVYCLTVEPTASFWDCPEFITTGYKLEIGHPPGAPFFMLMANFFTQFTNDPSQVAYMVNIMNALLSALCIMFLFWTISHLARKLLINNWDELTTSKLIAIEASGLVGALIYTFSDTFWFSAVEGEVYAFSSAFTAVVFWLILKWEDDADNPHSDRWLVLIAFMVGLSIGVHLLNLLCIPAIVLVYYYRRFPNANLKGSIIALFVSFAIIFAVLYGLIPGIITIGGWFELFFVNTLHCPFNTGVYIYIILLIGTVIWAIYESYVDKSTTRQNISFLLGIALLGIPFYSYGWAAALIGIAVLIILYFVLRIKKDKALLVNSRIKNTVMLSLLMMMIGYSSYAVIVIRSSANPPMDQNSPEDIFTLGSYLSRDQYGYRPLFYGQAYSSEYLLDDNGQVVWDEGAPTYQRKEKASPDEPDSYHIVKASNDHNVNARPVYAQNMFFPRMYSSQHAGSYEEMVDIEGKHVPSNYNKDEEIIIPTFWENFKFFISYQCNTMYWRYFGWNFIGRQNDIQNIGDLAYGNTISGISFIDNMVFGDQDKLPTELKENKGHNVFYALPLLLGLIGLFWQAFRGRRGIQQFWVVFFLFFMTGLAIVFYLNQTPGQPRERDYAYAGSFYAFAIWCGLGVAGIIQGIRKYFKDSKVGVIMTACVALACLFVPIQMGSQTWDDHDRSDRYTCRDFGQNYLMSLQDEGNPIIFTNGDNDTFPLWYNQETEGVGSNIRVCNLSYLQTDWYIDQMIRPAYDSPSVPIKWPRIDYCAGTNESVEVNPQLGEIMKLYFEMHPEVATLLGNDPFEWSNVLKYWILDKGDDKQRNLKQSIIETYNLEIKNRVKETLRREMMNNNQMVDEAYLENRASQYVIDVNKGKGVHIVPCNILRLPIDKQAVRQSGMKMVDEEIPDTMYISLERRGSLSKSDLMMLEMVANSNWKRPIYVATTVGAENYMNLGLHFVTEGLANRITPFFTDDRIREKQGLEKKENTDFDLDKTYDRMMNKFKYGNVSKKGIYLDETTRRMCNTHRGLFAELAIRLITENKLDSAKKVLEKMESVLPEYNVPVSYINRGDLLITAYGQLGNKKRATEIADKLWKNSVEWIEWQKSLGIDNIRNYFTGPNENCILKQLYEYKTSSGIWTPYMYYVLMRMEAVDKDWYNKHMAQFEKYRQEFGAYYQDLLTRKPELSPYTDMMSQN